MVLVMVFSVEEMEDRGWVAECFLGEGDAYLGMTWRMLIWSPALQKLASAQSAMYSDCAFPSMGMRTWRSGGWRSSLASGSCARSWVKKG